MFDTLPSLPRTFYFRPTLTVARELVGKLLIRRWERTILAARIVEVEAYLGETDPASHAFRGVTRRNSVMFGEGGHLYVYFTYGMHFCCNVVTEGEGKGRAVLLRALEPLHGEDVMARLRGLVGQEAIGEHDVLPSSVVANLCSGPGKLCQAFGITRVENGLDLTGHSLWIAEDPNPFIRRIMKSSRVGIGAGHEHHWRFYLRDNPFVSKGKPSQPPTPATPPRRKSAERTPPRKPRRK